MKIEKLNACLSLVEVKGKIIHKINIMRYIQSRSKYIILGAFLYIKIFHRFLDVEDQSRMLIRNLKPNVKYQCFKSANTA